MRKPPSKTALRNRADRLFSVRIRTRDGFCVVCGSSDYLQCAHVVSRRYLAVRWDDDNAVTLCRGCHKYYTEHPLEWDEFASVLLGPRLDELKRRARAGGRPDYPAILERLKEAS